MIREIGTRPTGVTFERDAATDTTCAVLGGRVLFRLPAFHAIASNVEVDWDDLDRHALPGPSPDPGCAFCAATPGA